MTIPTITESIFPPPVQSCPDCGATDLEVVSGGELTNFFCPHCVSCWHIELGYLHEVEVSGCGGCEHLPVCLLKKAVERDESAWLRGRH